MKQEPESRGSGISRLQAGEEVNDAIRDLDAQAAGKRMELALLLGDRDEARRQMKEMYAQTEARKAARFAMCRAMGAH